MKYSIYLISGLGADRRAFQKLVFPPNFELVYLDWISPQPNEQLEAYAGRLALKIDTSTPFYLIGLSFGGMLATEIAKKTKPVHTLIISSISVFKELSWYYRLSGNLSLQKLLPLQLFRQNTSVAMKFLGAKTQHERMLIKQLITDSDPIFMKWALTSILNWRNKERPLNLTHIHGTADYILPIKHCKPDVIINGGGHFMIYANADEVSACIKEMLLLKTDL